jgi:hypothetical protein
LPLCCTLCQRPGRISYISEHRHVLRRPFLSRPRSRSRPRFSPFDYEENDEEDDLVAGRAALRQRNSASRTKTKCRCSENQR